MNIGCPVEHGDPKTLVPRIRRFLRDEGSNMIAGPRRMPRSELVELVASVAEEEGIEATFFDHWELLEPVDGQVFFGQDLCHQVPAVVRFTGNPEPSTE